MPMLSRAEFLRMMAGAAGAALTGCRLQEPPSAPAFSHRRRPNVLLLLTDQERSWQDLPSGLRLPRRHAIAARGVSFQQYHVAAMACAPSRSAIYTGQHIQRTGVFDNPGKTPGRKELDPAATPTIGAMMRAAGYRTAYVGKWHLSSITRAADSDLRGALQSFGFDEYIPALADGDTLDAALEGLERDAPIAASVGRWLQANAGTKSDDRPWFLAVNLINPHDIQYLDATGHQREQVHPRFASEMSPVPDRDPYRDDPGFDLPASFPGPRLRPIAAHRAYVEDAEVFYGDLPLDDTAAWRRYQNYYFNCLRDVDRQIGAIVDALDGSPAGGGTMLVFSSDHGEMGGAQGLRLKGPFVYKENFRVPLLIVHPDIRSGAVSTSSLASGVDLAPTLLAAAGVTDEQRAERYPALKGRNLLAVAAAPRTAVRDALLFNCSIVHCCNPLKKQEMVAGLYALKPGERPAPRRFPDDFVQLGDRSFLRALFDGRYKLGRYFAPAQHHRPADWETLTRYNDLELYDTQTDPNEMKNLAADPAQRELILRLNGQLNALLDGEAGGDDGSYLSGDPALWRLE
ncbi:MAG: sulfatase-like hydrolase/transferase [Gammaproteobacteria bacterium]|nr:sulfatase-like hydrolase/transferase [Gammaproteobacteria bacterium]